MGKRTRRQVSSKSGKLGETLLGKKTSPRAERVIVSTDLVRIYPYQVRKVETRVHFPGGTVQTTILENYFEYRLPGLWEDLVEVSIHMDSAVYWRAHLDAARARRNLPAGLLCRAEVLTELSNIFHDDHSVHPGQDGVICLQNILLGEGFEEADVMLLCTPFGTSDDEWVIKTPTRYHHHIDPYYGDDDSDEFEEMPEELFYSADENAQLMTQEERDAERYSALAEELGYDEDGEFQHRPGHHRSHKKGASKDKHRPSKEIDYA